MSAPISDDLSSLSSSGFEDGLGRRVLAFDRETGDMLERLVLRPELAAFEKALLARIRAVSALDDERFAHPRDIEQDEDGRLTVVSEFVPGRRLSDALDTARDAGIVPGLDAALGLLLEMLPALGNLHGMARFAHGSVSPARVVFSPAGQIVMLDPIYGAVLERLGFTRQRLWNELGIAVSPSAEPARFDVAADLTQAGMTAAALIVGRPLGEADYPDGLQSLRAEILEVAQIRGTTTFAKGLEKFFDRVLPLAGRKAFPSADDAVLDLRQLVRREIGIDACRAALLDFFQQVESAEAERAATEDALAAQRAAEQREQIRLEAERQERERKEADRQERERLEQEARERARLEAERLEQQRVERERVEAERLEKERLERERIERERLEAEQRERERLEAERLEKERLERERIERERLEAELRERARLEAERREKERLERERLERERLEAELRERARLEAERREKERLERERLERERLELERLEAERRERERLEAERRERERLEAERLERERQARLEAERREKERLEAERRERERLAKLEAERKEKERLEAERRERERLEAERRERDRQAKLEAERKERERLEKERKERERLEAERREKERLEAERRERGRAEAERREKERAAAEQRERERLEQERREQERREQEGRKQERREQEIAAQAAAEEREAAGQPNKRRKRDKSARSKKDRLRSTAPATLSAGPKPTPAQAPAPAASKGSWLVSPDRAAAFDPPVPVASPPPVHVAAPQAYPVYVPPTIQAPIAAAPPASVVAPPVPAPPVVAPPVTTSIPIGFAPPKPVAQPQSAPIGLAQPSGIRLKQEPPPSPAPQTFTPRRDRDVAFTPDYTANPTEKPAGRIPWKIAAATGVVLLIGIATARSYLPGGKTSPSTPPTGEKSSLSNSSAPAPSSTTGQIVVATQPPGARVLLDGKFVGESPVTVPNVTPGRHTLTFAGESGNVKKSVRVEAGKNLTLDVPIFSGFVAVSAPIVVEVAEGSRLLGTSENQVMLPPGRHQLKFTNNALNYKETQTVEIEPGDVYKVSLDPRGSANINAQPWAEVWIDGVRVGETPIANVSIALGVREIVFRNPQFGERKLVTTITGGAAAPLSVDFTKQ
jgi:hypothetical protein